MRNRILGAMIAVTSLAIVAFGVPLGIVSTEQFRNREVGELQQEATLLLSDLPDTGIESSDQIVIEVLPEGVTAGIYNADGLLIAGDGPALNSEVVAAALRGTIEDRREGGDLTVAIPVFDENTVIGAIRVSEPWSVVVSATQRRWTLMALIGIAAAAGAALLGVALSRRLVAPIGDLVTGAVRLGDGDFAHRIASTGVAELDRAGDAMNRTAGRLGSLISRERSFSADVSHQLSTPLTSLRLVLESSLVTPGADHKAAVEEAVGQLDRLQATVETLLAFARDKPTTGDEADPGEVCRLVANEAQRSLSPTGRLLVLDIGEDTPKVRCHRQVLHEILAVLVNNSVDHGAGEVMITVRRRGAGATISVSDQGDGVPSDQADRIFLRRGTTAGGHGIGLALARSLADANNLRLELTVVGPGPVFTLACPGVEPSP